MLDFQRSPTDYLPRQRKNATLAELMESAERVEKGVQLTPELDQALQHGSSLGGARPKALIDDGDKKYIAKFSATNDLYNVVKAEFVAMRSEEHTSELQSLMRISYAVFCLKKKKQKNK